MQSLESTISSWGKSTALRIPSALVKASGLRIGQTVRLESSADGSITIRPVLARPDLAALLAQVTPENLPDQADVLSGKPAGSEVW
ncbi:MAG: AbrB/MazE/SpoVT family DNA-binding domain-containing protein [Rhodoferax sp.]|nr:AbrB/MazE/SpoVT family DNA-binding domain-containing protein [Rhodoferax sp.]